MNIVHQLQPQNLLKKQIFFLFGIIIIMVTILEIWAVNRLATFGDQISKTNEAKNALKLENQLLENQIAQQSSLLQAANTAQALGFENIKNIQYINSKNLALNR